MDYRSQSDKTREPIFRSALEGPQPTYEPLKPESARSVIKRLLAPLATSTSSSTYSIWRRSCRSTAVGAMSLAFQVVGLAVMVALLFVAPIMALIALLGLPELWNRWRMRKTPEGRAYYDIPLRDRVAVGAVYVGLIVVLGLLTGSTFVTDPASLR